MVAGRRADDPLPGVLLLYLARAGRAARAAARAGRSAVAGHRQRVARILPYDAVRAAPDPAAALRAFYESAYRAGTDAAGWDVAALARP